MQRLAFAWFATILFAVSLAWFFYAYLITYGEAAAAGDRWRPLLLDTALFTGFAVHHSVFARTRLKRVVADAFSPALERAVYTLIASVLFLAVCILWVPVPGILYSLSTPWRYLGYAAQAAGLLVTIRASSALDVLDLSGVRQAAGANRDVHLETRGVYGLVRHPLYFGWVLFVFGAPHMTMTRFWFAIVSTAYLALAIPFEERSLIGTFGSDYRRYQQQVRWRMLPFLY